MAYKSLVRPVLEHATATWDPYTNDNIAKLQMAQRRAARFLLNRFHPTASVSDMVSELQWDSLEERRKRNRLTFLYKMHNGQTGIDATKYLTPLGQKGQNVAMQIRRLTKSNSLIPDCFKFSIFSKNNKE